MGDDKLKGSVSFSRKVNVGNYSSIDISAYREFYADERKATEVLNELAIEMDAWLSLKGLVANTNLKMVK